MLANLANLLFHPVSNAIMTVLTGITALYWIFTFIAGDFLGDLDFSPDIDTGVDVDTDTDADVADNAPEKSFFAKAMEYINVGKVPFMVVYSTFKFISWILTLVSSVLLGAASWGWKSALLLLPVFFVAYFITRYATKPFIRIYRAMGYTGEEAHDLIGRVAQMRSAIQEQKIGSAELVIKNDVIRINVMSKSGAPIAYNADVMIAEESKDKRYYLVVPEINLNNVV